MKSRSPRVLPRDGSNESPWQAVSSESITLENNEPDIETSYDVVIIGGGITGVTAALYLQNAGKKCIILEAHNIGFGTTGGTSAHINTFADTTYKEAESGFGKDGAKLFADAINEGFSIIRENIKKYGINCEFELKKGYVYAEDDKQVDQLRDIHDGIANLGLQVRYAKDAPTPLQYKKAIELDDQAQFHPLKYLTAVASEYLKVGGTLIENTSVTAVESQDDRHIVKTDKLVLQAANVIYATHIPSGLNIFSLRCAPYRSYVLAVALKDNNYPDALVYDMQEPYHYFRTHELGGKKYLLAGGNDHKTGHDDPQQAFSDLEKYVRKHYNISSIHYKWSSQYYVPVDGFPYIGQMPGQQKGIFCATGYNGNGMMLGSIAGKILCDLIVDGKNKYEKIFDPARIKPMTGLKDFITENADVAYQFIKSRFSAHEVDFIKRVQKDSGKVVEFEGRKMAIYRDTEGTIHALDPTCTHAKCIVNWNSEEKSWDCPCHGARYDIDGKVLNGPADKGLPQIIVE